MLGTLQNKTEQRVSLWKHGACKPVCACLYKSVCAPSATGILLSTPQAQDALTYGFGTCSELFFFPQKNFSLDSLLCQVEMAGKVMAGFICPLRLHFWHIMLQRPAEHPHIRAVAEGVRTQGPVCSYQRQ